MSCLGRRLNIGGTQAGDTTRPRGRLHIFLGATPGAGKTHAMLTEGRRRASAGETVVVALLEGRGRSGLLQAARGLDIIPPRRTSYRGTAFDEPDYEAARARSPDLALVDELAHTNVPGSRHEKRWQDVKELLDAA
jgi:two-component system, OmpR family, sensor histidine kinase KdpD